MNFYEHDVTSAGMPCMSALCKVYLTDELGRGAAQPASGLSAGDDGEGEGGGGAGEEGEAEGEAGRHGCGVASLAPAGRCVTVLLYCSRHARHCSALPATGQSCLTSALTTITTDQSAATVH